MRQSGTHMDAHLKHDANCYISVCSEHYADLVAERDALQAEAERVRADVAQALEQASGVRRRGLAEALGIIEANPE